MKLSSPVLRWIIVLLLTMVVAFEFIQTAFAMVSAEESTAIIFFAAMASLIVGLPNKQYKTLTSLMVVLGSIASVALAGLWSPAFAAVSVFFVVFGLSLSLILEREDIRREDIHPILLLASARLHPALLFVKLRLSSVGIAVERAGRSLHIALVSRFPTLERLLKPFGSTYKTVKHSIFAFSSLVISAVSWIASIRMSSVIYRARASILVGIILFASVTLPSHAITWRSEYVKNGSFDQGFDGWTVPMVRYRDESFSNEHWFLPGKNCLTMIVSSRKGQSYDSLAVSQPLDVELSWGRLVVSGYIGNNDVGLNPGSAECDALATSVIIVMKDNIGKTKYLKYAVLVQGEMSSTPSEGVIEVGRGEARHFSFTRDLISSIQEVWNVPYVIGWRVMGVELLVEFRGNWGDALHLEAVFDEVSLRRESDSRWLVQLAGFAMWWLPIACLPMMIWSYSRVPKERLAK